MSVLLFLMSAVLFAAVGAKVRDSIRNYRLGTVEITTSRWTSRFVERTGNGGAFWSAMVFNAAVILMLTFMAGLALYTGCLMA